MSARKLISVLLLSLSLFLSLGDRAFALNPATHEAISGTMAQMAASPSGFSLNNYLIRQLGLPNGIKEEFAGRNVRRWLELGSRYEDVPPWHLPYLRSFNHFHDPLTDKGFSGLGLSWRSSIEWGLLPPATQSPGGYYSWSDVRWYFFAALTAQGDAFREQAFAETFRGVGQLMHLVQDASVPAHTRNDPHVFYSYESYVSDPRNVDISTLGVAGPAGPLPLAALIDANMYVSPSPDPGVTASPGIGLSEYAQANFFSEDTIQGAGFPHPAITPATPVVAKDYSNALSGTTYKRQYWLKDCCGETNGGQGYLLAAVDWLDYYRDDPA